eukprot:gnl/Chilomastix_cuspidata/1966.p1 GENE.gnl/Chilomastix_cuspidata/1966~~gnl/Chilomastix_cuspidata/1966.p1  ORF type:complete len:204 (+),score=94.58 gnl/Chilomastix_cuspidata/1966:430-1041(+)
MPFFPSRRGYARTAPPRRMFYKVEMKKTIYIAPKMFRAKPEDEVLRQLRNLEGQQIYEGAVIVCVIAIKSLDRGVVNFSTGYAGFVVVFDTLVMYVRKNDIVLATVVDLLPTPSDPLQTSFLCQAGSLRVHVPAEQVPPGAAFQEDAENGKCLIDRDGETVLLKRGTLVRIRIRSDPNISGLGRGGTNAIGEMLSPGLGPVAR